MPRNWRNEPGDNTGRLIEYDELTIPYSAAYQIEQKANVLFIEVGQLTGDMTINANLDYAEKWDEITLTFKADGTARIVNTGESIKSLQYTIPANKKAVMKLMFDGAHYLQTGGYIEPEVFIPEQPI